MLLVQKFVLVVIPLMNNPVHIYICEFRNKEARVEASMTKIVPEFRRTGKVFRDQIPIDGRYHVETF